MGKEHKGIFKGGGGTQNHNLYEDLLAQWEQSVSGSLIWVPSGVDPMTKTQVQISMSREVGKRHGESEVASIGSTIKAATATGDQILTPREILKSGVKHIFCLWG